MTIAKTTMTDHEFAAHLSKHGALGNFHPTPSSVAWRNDAGEVVAIALYDNAKSTREIFCVE